MIDVSFSGGFVTIEAEAIGSTTISEFADEGSPVEVDEIEVTGHQLMLDGSVLYWTKPTAYFVKVSVIAGSGNDESLTKLLELSHPGGRFGEQNTDELTVKMEVSSPRIYNGGSGADNFGGSAKRHSFSDGRMLSGSPAISVDSEGKIQAKTFSFVFAQHN